MGYRHDGINKGNNNVRGNKRVRIAWHAQDSPAAAMASSSSSSYNRTRGKRDKLFRSLVSAIRKQINGGGGPTASRVPLDCWHRKPLCRQDTIILYCRRYHYYYNTTTAAIAAAAAAAATTIILADR
jgi:hypothetical protein